MTVDTTQLGSQTRYTLRDRAALPCRLTFGADAGAPAEWTIVVPGTGASGQLPVARRFAAPAAVRLRAWLAPIVGPARAAELAGAVSAEPPQSPGWQRHTPAAADLSIPRQRDHRA
jgi:hypothetical protein